MVLQVHLKSKRLLRRVSRDREHIGPMEMYAIQPMIFRCRPVKSNVG